MRSLLILSGADLGAASRFGADVLVLDVPGPGAAATETSLGDDRPTLVVKVSPVRSGLVDAELDASMSLRPDAIWLTDALGGRDVQHLAAKLAVREAELELADGCLRILASLDSAAGILSAGTIPGASARLIGLTWCAPKMARSIGAEAISGQMGAALPPLVHARSTVLFAAAAASVPAIDGVCTAGDERTLRAECLAARRDGFRGKLASHPSEVAIINEVFAGP